MAIEIGTSDRTLFKRCRRRWNWQSRLGLQATGPHNIHLFVGTGIHFALEDYHGIRHYTDAQQAFTEYVHAYPEDERPQLFDNEMFDKCLGMLRYYSEVWQPKHLSNLRQVYMDDKPAVEVRFSIPFHYMKGVTKRHKVGRNYAYTGTFDRIVQDEYDRYWIVDYKTAAQFDTAKLETDPQVAAYTWAAEQILGQPFEGVIWIQLMKDYPQPPRRLQNGSLSKAKDQRTTHHLFREALIEEYGNVPDAYIETLNALAEKDTINGDRFIRYDMVRKNAHAVVSETQKIIAEAREMSDPKLAMYPNPTRDCAWDCPFRSPCIAMDDGFDHEFILAENYEQAPSREERDTWRPKIQYPNDPVLIQL